ncbi:MAG: hypothetical protein HOP13_16265 [Alphaproteobacteria bacterium]|nr:hypothetical protein [Alphaproteobacteria bacterium]
MLIVETRLSGAIPQLQPVYVSPDAPEATLDALRDHPLYDWARDARAPVFLSEVDEKLALRGMSRAQPLAAIEGFMVNIEVSLGHLRHFGLFGEGGLASGLSRSLLHVATLLAHQHLLAPRPLATAAPAVAARVTPTPREREVLDLAMAGLADAQIGKTLGLATRTVRFHLRNIRRKLHVSTRHELIALAAQGFGRERK